MSFMPRIISMVAVLTFAFVPLSLSAEQSEQVVAPVAKVGNIVISQSEVDQRAQRLLPMQVSFHGSLTAEKVAEVKEKALNELIDRAYKVQYAIDEEISVDAVSFEKGWQKKMAKNPKAARNASASQLDKIRADIYLDQLASRAEEIAVDEKVAVSDQVVSSHYDENKEKYFRPKLYTASHILVKVDPSENAEEREKKRERAETLYRRALAGEDFYNLAYYESDDRSKYVGGSLGSFHAGQTVAEFDSAIQTMKPGDIIGPIRTMYGFHIIRLDAFDDERQMRFDEVSTKIRAQLEEDEREQIYGQWMLQLKKRYPLGSSVK